MAAEGEASGQKHRGLMIRRRSRVQFPEIGQRVDVVFLLKVSEAEIELNLTQLRTYTKSSLVDLDSLSIAMGFGIEHAQVRKCAYIARIGGENFVETRFSRRVVSGIQRLHRGLESLPGCIGRRKSREGNRYQNDGKRGLTFHEQIFFTSLVQALLRRIVRKKWPDPSIWVRPLRRGG